MKRWILYLGAIVWWAGAMNGLLRAQDTPDMIFYNGKIVTVDNDEVNENLGTVGQAIAIRGGKVLAVGSNDQIRKMAGPSTKSLDLKGRLMTPGFGATHDHPQDWNTLNEKVVHKVLSDDVQVERFMNVRAEQVIQQFPRVLEEAVQKSKPGNWIRISLLYGPEYRWVDEVSALMGRQITKQMLDLAAPNNPVEIRGGFVGMMINQKGIDLVKKFYEEEAPKFAFHPLVDLPGMDITVEKVEQTGVCGVCYRQVEQDVLYSPSALKEIYRLGLSWTTALGVTLNSTSLYTGGAISAFDSLDREGKMTMRLAWGYFWPYRNDFLTDPYLSRFVRSMEGRGSDYLWVHGFTSHMGMTCSKLPGTSPEVKKREMACGFTDPLISRALYEYIKAGGRLAGDHQMGDGEIDLVLDIIEKASKDAGMTPQQIRSKRHVTEHLAMYPRPDQIPRFKELGIMGSGWDITIWEGTGKKILEDYGERGANMVVPRKALYDAGIINSVEIDRPLSEYTNLTYFHVLYSGITRKDQDGNIIAPQQGISRQAMLKSATLWAAYGGLRENVLGSLKPGKWADLIVMDKDYTMVSVDDIPKLKVLATVLGGSFVHLAPSLAREWGLQPAGAQIELGGPAAQW